MGDSNENQDYAAPMSSLPPVEDVPELTPGFLYTGVEVEVSDSYTGINLFLGVLIQFLHVYSSRFKSYPVFRSSLTGTPLCAPPPTHSYLHPQPPYTAVWILVIPGSPTCSVLLRRRSRTSQTFGTWCVVIVLTGSTRIGWWSQE